MPVYLDCAATTPIDPRVAERVMHYLQEEFGNAGSRTHDWGVRARRAVEQARDQVARVVNAGRGDVVFTSGATESNNLAILGLADWGREHGRMHLLSTAIEHHAVLEPLRHLERHGFELTLLRPQSGGWIDPVEVRQALRDDTLLVSVMHANNETGVLQPIDAIADALADHPAWFHVDAAQSFGRSVEPLRSSRIDLISASGHKLHAPKGVGALIARRRGEQRPPLSPRSFGGGQERGLRPGTLAVPLIAGFGLASELALLEQEERADRCRAFRHHLLEALRPLQPAYHGAAERTLPHIVNFSVPGVEAEEAMEALTELVAVSDGAACTSSVTTCSHVLGAMGVAPALAAGAMRWSWSHLTAEPDWGRVVQVLRTLQQGHRVPTLTPSVTEFA